MVLKLDSKLVILILLLVEGGRGPDHTEEGAPLSKFFFNCPGKGDVELDEEDEEGGFQRSCGIGKVGRDRSCGFILVDEIVKKGVYILRYKVKVKLKNCFELCLFFECSLKNKTRFKKSVSTIEEFNCIRIDKKLQWWWK